jgi:hypothetical protein
VAGVYSQVLQATFAKRFSEWRSRRGRSGRGCRCSAWQSDSCLATKGLRCSMLHCSIDGRTSSLR